MHFLDPDILQPLALSFFLALSTTIILLVMCTPLAWWMARSRSVFSVILETVVSLPLVLPPTVLGFYLLVWLNPQSMLGKFWFSFTGEMLVFHVSGLLIGSMIYSLPFVIRPLLAAFSSMDSGLLEVAATLRATPRDRFFSVVLPLARPAYISAAVLGFAHTLGEFGVVLMVGGNIPGRTRTLSIAIYDHVEQMHYAEAQTLSLVMVALACVLLGALFSAQKSSRVRGLI